MHEKEWYITFITYGVSIAQLEEMLPKELVDQ